MPPNSGGFIPGDPRINRRGPVGKHALGFARRVREATGDGRDALDFALSVMKGEVFDEVPKQDGGVVQVVCPARVRLDAAKWLIERGFGRVVDIGDPEDDPLAGKSEREMALAVVDVLPMELKRVALEHLTRQLASEGTRQ